MRVHELAKECDVSNKELIEILGDLGIEGKSHSSALTADQVRTVRDDLGLLPGQHQATDKVDMTEKEAEAETVEVAEEAPAEEAAEEEPVEEKSNIVDIKGPIPVRELAELLDIKTNKLIMVLMKRSIMATINHLIDAKLARDIAVEHGFELYKEPKPEPKAAPKPVAGAPEVAPKKAKKKKKKIKKTPGEKHELADGEVIRPPMVAFLGHVDHGKTSLLDHIRKTRVVSGESGGITQHIGAYTVEAGGGKITFLDTPGHSAFEQMRERGARLTDIMILVIAADDGIMPQTKEAIKHALAAETTIIVAINKIDLPAADPLRVRTQMQEHGLPCEEWGGDVGVVEVSAHTGQGIDELLERINLECEMMELTATPNSKAHGYVVEAQMEPGMGPTANFIVRDGTLKIGDGLVCGGHYGKVKSLMNENGERIKTAGPSTAVKVLGMNTVPDPSEPWKAVKNDREARKLAETYVLDKKEARETAEGEVKLSLDDLFAQAGLSEVKELPVIIKADVQGSVEAIRHNLLAIESDKVKLKIIDASVGNVSNKDVMKACAGNAVLLGFHTGIEAGVNKIIKKEGVEVRLYSIIYELIDQVAAAMKGLLEPEAIEESLGKAEVRASFPFGKKGRVAGCLVQEGRLTSDARVRIIRRKDVIYEGSVVSLRRYKDQVKDVPAGQECGVQFDNFSNIEEKDIIEAYKVKYVEQEL